MKLNVLPSSNIMFMRKMMYFGLCTILLISCGSHYSLYSGTVAAVADYC